jgi:hypothetical protein
MRKTATFMLGLFVVSWTGYTVSAVLRYGGAVLLDLNTTGRIMSVRSDDLIHSAIGLTYHGAGGALLVVIETLVVLAALWFGIRGYGARRLAAVTVVVGWTALWLVMAAALLLTLAWAGLRLTEPNRGVDSGKDSAN